MVAAATAAICAHGLQHGRTLARAAPRRHHPDLPRCHGFIGVSSHLGLHDAEARAERLRIDRRRAQQIHDDGLGAFMGYWHGLPLLEAKRDNAEWWAERLAHDPPALASIIEVTSAGHFPSATASLRSWQRPLHFIAGERDARYTASAKASALELTRAQASIISHCGHVVHADQPAELARLFVHIANEMLELR